MINGIVNVYKEKDFTSHDVVAKLRGILKQKKIGHTGTLDPQAVGVLPVCLGNATKLCELLTDKEKTYKATLILGITSDTEDMTGKVKRITSEDEVKKLDKEKVIEIIKSFIGEYDQIPPMYSALKVNGKKLYELAREGKEIERKPRKVGILDIDIDAIELPKVVFTVTCSKGTYIRSLCRDIGEKLGVGGCMDELIRTKVSSFYIENAYKLSEIEDMVKNEKAFVTSIEDMLKIYEKIKVTKEYDKLVVNGNKLEIKSLIEAGIISDNVFAERKVDTKEESDSFIKLKEIYYRIYDSNDKLIGLYKRENAFLKPYKMFS
ncbi:tRNA pseudouridine(55) synthase TruB [Eubacterium sp.]|uniref:tRNA pseudouridine(55) synthase TruB n=1 Tax=Eubacterium sp. TaxID=142586 RepID=UPI0025D5DFD6|nr:tRNA pseudouridine(55) synthase TruB [Eubacterium sp.]MCR5629520.1 tRNA pseudouridine(55) synthase TruB [Eubacterium sp.]